MIVLLASLVKPFVPGWADLGPFVAECWLIVTMVALLLAPFFTRRANLVCAGVAVLGLTAALVHLLSVGVMQEGARAALGGMLIGDHFAMLWKAMLLVFVIGIVLMWMGTTSHTMHEGDGPEFFTLLIGATLGMAMMASTTNLLMIVIAMEMASLPSYVMAGFRKTHKLGAEASLKYVLFGAATSAIMVWGLSLLYGMYGTLKIEELAREMARGTVSPALLTVALISLVVGIGFKVSAVPLHFWCPDVFEGASIEVSAFLSVASKGAALALLTRVLMTISDAFGYEGVTLVKSLAIGIGVMGAVTATVGNTAAFVQTNIKRLLAYSSIAHAGYMLCAVSLLYSKGTTLVNGQGLNGPAGVLLFYLAVYLFMNLGAFAVAGVVFRQTDREDLGAFSGLVRRAPLLAHCMLACLVSLVGLPPFAGFFAKLNVLLLLIENGGWWWWLVAVIGVNTVLSLYYYVRVLKAMYLEQTEQPAFVGHPIGTAVAVVSALALVLMFVAANPLSRLTRDYSKIRHVVAETAIVERR